jgi:hypothetical protein
MHLLFVDMYSGCLPRFLLYSISVDDLSFLGVLCSMDIAINLRGTARAVDLNQDDHHGSAIFADLCVHLLRMPACGCQHILGRAHDGVMQRSLA